MPDYDKLVGVWRLVVTETVDAMNSDHLCFSMFRRGDSLVAF